MANNMKKYIITALTLGLIAAGSAALIGGVNLLTRERIKQNELNNFNKGVVALFGDQASVDMQYKNEVNKGYIQDWYWVHFEDGSESAYIFKTSGSNSYGKVTLLVGFDSSKLFVGTYVITNEQTYASTLVDNYLVPLNNGERDKDDVSCGATYGAKLVRDMIDAAQEYCNGIIID